MERKIRKKRKRKREGRNKLRWERIIRKEERRKILKELRKEKYVFYSSYDFFKSLSEEFSDYYRGRYSLYIKYYF